MPKPEIKDLFVPYNLTKAISGIYGSKGIGIIYPDGEVVVGTPEFVTIMMRKEPNCIQALLYQEAIDIFEKNDIDIYCYRLTTFKGKPYIIKMAYATTEVFINHGIPHKVINHWENKYEGLNKAFEEAMKLI